MSNKATLTADMPECPRSGPVSEHWEAVPAAARSNRLKTLIAFAAGFAATITAVALLPTSRDERYAALTGDGRQLTAVYARITANPKPIDIAFIGSSRTMTGIDDKGVEAGLATAGQPLSVANLSAPGGGRDLDLLVARLLFAYKSPKLIVIEVARYETPYGHALLPFVGDLPEILCCKEYLNYRVASSFLYYLRTKLRGAWATLASSSPERPLPHYTYTWAPLAGEWDKTQEPLWSQLDSKDYDGARGALKQRFVRWVTPFSLDAVRRIVALAGERGTKVAFLYLPTRHNLIGHKSFENAAFYRSFGPVVSVPEDIGEEDRYWHDPTHLNAQGAELLVPGLVEDIVHLGVVKSTTEAEGLHRDMRSGASGTSNDAQSPAAKGI